MLTDVEASTRLWETAPAVAGSMIARHYELLDAAISAGVGVRPQEQGEGDSVVAVFDDALAAVRAAIQAQRAIEAEAWPAPHRLRVRMALHSGQATKRGTANYVGPTIIRCARLRACGHGGQILLSDATAALVRGQLDAGCSVISLGLHRLKDLDAAEHVHQIIASGLRSSFAPLRSLQPDRHNLPLQPTPLIGRADEVAQIGQLMSESRIVTLTGAGGVGKTRLALQVAAETIDRFHGGVWWVDLATISDPDAVSAAVLHAVGGAEQPNTAVLDQLVVVLKPESSLLLLLDNCEHVVAGCAAVVERILGACPGIGFVATSREPLAVSGETTWRVASLQVPDNDEIADPDGFSALVLFWDRARRARPQLEATPAWVAASARICRRVDGIPLAVELAAARCRQLSPERIANELESRYRLLTGGGRTQLARQRTLEASVDWSHALLSDEERIAFRRLAVFVGWFPLNAAEGILGAFGDIDSWAVMDLVGRLVDKSLLVINDEDTEPNYRMLETVRFYALQRADEAHELERLRDAHATWWSNWLAAVDDPWALGIIDALERWYPNLWAAFTWVASDFDRSIPFVIGLGTYTSGTDRLTDCKHLHTVAVELHRLRHPRWCEVANYFALAAIMAGEVEYLLGPVSEAYEAAIAEGDDRGAAECMLGLALLDPSGGGWRQLARHAERAEYVDLAAMGRVGIHALFAEPLGVAADELPRIEQAIAIRGSFIHAATLLAMFETVTAQGRLAGGRTSSDTLLEFTRDTGFAQQLWAMAGSALVMLLHEDSTTIADIIDRCAARCFRGVPFYFAGIWLAGIEVAAHHLLRAPLEVERVADALTSTMTDTNTIAVRTLVAELIDRGLTAPVRAAVERFRAIPSTEDSFRRMVHDWFAAQLAAAEGNYNTADDALRDILPRALKQGAVPLVIDALELLARLCAPAAAQRAGRLVHAADAARAEIGYRFRFPNHAQAIAQIPRPTAEAPMSLNHAVAYVLRTHGRRGRPTVGWASLTPTELDVARLVAEGATNPAIAEKLTMTVNTVKTHLAHIFTKLDINSRAQLASIVTEQRSS
ncbi:MAG: LuxR C-terminal-related transcriptional regulator [Acidimicrobiales bacterium]